MPCYKEETVLKCRWLVGGVSLCVLGIGIAQIAYGFVKLQQNDTQAPKNTADLKSIFSTSYTGGIALACLIGGAVATFIGLCGFCVIKCRNPFITCPFMTLAFFVSALCIIAGVMIMDPNTFNSVYFQACTAVQADIAKSGSEFANLVYGTMVDKQMCTDLCPCPAAAKAEILKIYPDNAKLQAQFGRNYDDWSKYDQKAKADIKSKRDSGQYSNLVQPLVFADSGTDGKDFFSTYKSCYDNKVKKTYEKDQDKLPGEMQPAAKSFITNDVYSVLSTLEQTFNCSSFCKTPLFSLNSPITAATMPSQDCITGMFKLNPITQGIAIICFVTGGLLFLSFFCAIPLCCGPPKNEDEE